MEYTMIGAALAIGLSGLWVALGQWILAKSSIDVLGKNPTLASDVRIFTILGIALVESAAIYGFIVAYQIITSDVVTSSQAIGAGIAIGATAFWAWLGEWKLVSGSIEALARNPANKAVVLQFMILFVALVESAAIYGLIIAQRILG